MLQQYEPEEAEGSEREIVLAAEREAEPTLTSDFEALNNFVKQFFW